MREQLKENIEIFTSKGNLYIEKKAFWYNILEISLKLIGLWQVPLGIQIVELRQP